VNLEKLDFLEEKVNLGVVENEDGLEKKVPKENQGHKELLVKEVSVEIQEKGVIMDPQGNKVKKVILDMLVPLVVEENMEYLENMVQKD